MRVLRVRMNHCTFVKHKIANFALTEVRAQPGMDRERNPGTKPHRQHSQKPLTSTGAFWLSSVIADGPPLWLPGNQSMLGFSCFSSGSGEERKLFKDNKHLSTCRAVWLCWAAWAVASSNSHLKSRKPLWKLYLISKHLSTTLPLPSDLSSHLLPGTASSRPNLEQSERLKSSMAESGPRSTNSFVGARPPLPS